MRFSFILLLFVTFKSMALSVSEAESLALERSSILKAKDMELKAINNEQIVQGLWSNPQLLGQVGGLDSGSTKGSTLEFSLTQAVPISSKYSLKRKIAKLALASQEKNLDYYKNWIKHQVKLAMWRVYVTDELHRHGQERSRRFSLIKKSLKTRAKVSIKQRVEQNVIESQLMLLEKEQDIKKHNLFLAINDLEFWIGRKVEPSEIKLKIPSVPSAKIMNSISNFDLDKNIEFQKTSTLVKSAELDVRLKKNERLPDLILGGGYRQENVNPENNFMYAIVGLNIPLWDSGSNRVQLSKNKLEMEKNNLEDLKKRLDLVYHNQSELVKMSLHQIERFPLSLLQKNERAISEAEKGFRQSVIDVSVFIQAETQSHEMIDQVYVTWMQYLENLSALFLLNNQDLNWEG